MESVAYLNQQIEIRNSRESTHSRALRIKADAKMNAMIFRTYWLDRRDQGMKEPHWVKVRIMYGTGLTELLWVLDAERGIYPVLPSDLKTEWDLPRKARQELKDERRYAYLAK